MTTYLLREAVRPDGQPYKCFRTFNVFVGNSIPGMIQCEGPCYGLFAAPDHRHGPWIAFTGSGDAARDLPGRHVDMDAAVRAVLGA